MWKQAYCMLFRDGASKWHVIKNIELKEKKEFATSENDSDIQKWLLK